jgi:hypothetical protein
MKIVEQSDSFTDSSNDSESDSDSMTTSSTQSDYSSYYSVKDHDFHPNAQDHDTSSLQENRQFQPHRFN